MMLKPSHDGTGQTGQMLPTQLETDGEAYRGSLDVPSVLLIMWASK